MKNIRLFINCKNLDMLQAFSDEVYLYDYIVNNYSELPEENIFRNPTLVKRIEEMIYFSKNNISNAQKEICDYSVVCMKNEE